MEIQEGLKTINMYPAAAITLGFFWSIFPSILDSDFAQVASPPLDVVVSP